MQQNSVVMDNFVAIGGAVSTVLSDGIAKAAFNEGCSTIRNLVMDKSPDIKQKLNELGIQDDQTALQAVAKIAGLYKDNYEQAQIIVKFGGWYGK